MSDDVISAGHEISKPCYFMPVYTSASVQKCPHVDVSKKKKKGFQGSVLHLGKCFTYIEKECSGKWMSECEWANDIAQCAKQEGKRSMQIINQNNPLPLPANGHDIGGLCRLRHALPQFNSDDCVKRNGRVMSRRCVEENKAWQLKYVYRHAHKCFY